MKNKFFLGIILGFLAPTILLLLFLNFGINQEDLTFNTKFEFINANDVKEKHKNSVICIFSTGCPGKNKTTPFLIENIKRFKKNNIDFIVIADELYKNSVDFNIDNFKKEYKFNENIYLLDKNKYSKNSGFFNAKKRYKDFIFELCGEGNNCMFGYVNYTLIKDGKFVNHFGSDLSEKDLLIYKK